MPVYTSIEQLIGNTPLLELKNIEKDLGLTARVLAKLESFNPAGSAKDRAAKAMLDDAFARGVISPGAVIIEPTSGNTGIGLSLMAVSRGCKAIIVMPDTMSPERIALMQAFGAKVELTPGALGMVGAIARAKEIQKETPNSFIPDQFSNPANAKAHFDATGPEIWRDTDGNIDFFVAGVGTGGTVTGVGRYLKSRNPNIKVAAVEPAASPLLSGGTAASHGLQGIGANFIPDLLDREVYDEVIPVTDEAAFKCTRLLCRREGVLAGVSSGAALSAAIEIAKRPENAGKTVVALLPDTGERYLSSGVFSDSED